MRRLAIWTLFCVPLLSAVAAGGEVDDRDQADFFERKVRPLLVEKCQKCHGADKSHGNLRLRSRDEVLKGGDSGPAAIPGKPDESLLILAVEYLDDPRMPPDGKLSENEIDVLKGWVAQGVHWPNAGGEPLQSSAAPTGTTAEQLRWWAFQPLRVEAPSLNTKNGQTCNPIDRFIDEQIAAARLVPFPPAQKRTLIRRATFDLIGLPPTPAEVGAFLSDESPDAFDKVVERLLASPQYGERWGRHWLDLVRYADYFEGKPGSHGSAAKFEIFEAFRYRDWVVQSFNRDLPYDQFVVHQIAGDRLAAPSADAPYVDGLAATTVLAIGAWDNGDADKHKVLSDIVDDQINVVGQTFLGLTLACARCHDHKFDPITTEDYYALAGMFYSSRVLENLGTKGDHTVLLRTPLVGADYLNRRREQLERLAQLKAELDKLQPSAPAAGAGAPPKTAASESSQPASVEAQVKIAELTAERDHLQTELLPETPKALGAADGGTPGSLFPSIQDVPIHVRGSYAKLGPVVPRGLPKSLAGADQPPIREGSGRLELARWIASTDNPLTARVMANRIWQGHFGEGLVRTPSNFGKLGERPTHPALLDWLAAEFIRSGWSVKSMHRLIMNSAAYRRASSAATDAQKLPHLVTQDPDNRLFARWAPRRLEAECIRDAMLSTAGALDTQLGGPAGDDLGVRRRSLYVQTTRWSRAYFSSLFDAADPDQPIGKRNVTTVAPQALFFLNHSFVREQAERLAARLSVEAADDSVRLSQAYELLFSRPPGAEEAAVASEFLRRRAASGAVAAWTDLVQLLMASNEFSYVD